MSVFCRFKTPVSRSECACSKISHSTHNVLLLLLKNVSNLGVEKQYSPLLLIAVAVLQPLPVIAAFGIHHADVYYITWTPLASSSSNTRNTVIAR